MQKQKGSLSAGVMVALGLLAVIGVTLVVLASSYISANNYGARIEAQLKAEKENMGNILAQGQQKVLEAAQVPDMMRDDLVKVVQAAISGRYGDGGSKATFQWIQEQNPSLDSAVYVKIQQLVESYRNEFKTSQTRMIDVKRQYEAEQGLFWRGMWLRIAGFPKLDLSQYKAITTDRVEETFKNGKESGPLELRKK